MIEDKFPEITAKELEDMFKVIDHMAFIRLRVWKGRSGLTKWQTEWTRRRLVDMAKGALILESTLSEWPNKG